MIEYEFGLLFLTHQNSPLVFLDKFKDKVNTRELKSYDLIEILNNRFVELKEDEKLLCLLLENGFTQRELCAIFNLNKINNLYIKYNRIRKKWYDTIFRLQKVLIAFEPVCLAL